MALQISLPILISVPRCRIFGGRRKCSEPNDLQSRYLRMALGLQRRAAMNLKIERYGAGGTQRLPRSIGTPAALMHILMGDPLTPREAERKGLVHETVSGKALDRAMEIAQRLSSYTPESVAYIKRLVRNATATPLAQGLALERNLFLKLCITEPALARMRSYEEENITSPSRFMVVKQGV